jgi:hypothetical protein
VNVKTDPKNEIQNVVTRSAGTTDVTQEPACARSFKEFEQPHVLAMPLGSFVYASVDASRPSRTWSVPSTIHNTTTCSSRTIAAEARNGLGVQNLRSQQLYFVLLVQYRCSLHRGRPRTSS